LQNIAAAVMIGIAGSIFSDLAAEGVVGESGDAADGIAGSDEPTDVRD